MRGGSTPVTTTSFLRWTQKSGQPFKLFDTILLLKSFWMRPESWEQSSQRCAGRLVLQKRALICNVCCFHNVILPSWLLQWEVSESSVGKRGAQGSGELVWASAHHCIWSPFCSDLRWYHSSASCSSLNINFLALYSSIPWLLLHVVALEPLYLFSHLPT